MSSKATSATNAATPASDNADSTSGSSASSSASVSAASAASLSLLQLHQMIFIYNAVMAGWSVNRVEETGNFRFKKRLETQEHHLDAQQDGFLRRFVHNMQRLQATPTTSAASATPAPRRLASTTLESFEISPDQDIPI